MVESFLNCFRTPGLLQVSKFQGPIKRVDSVEA
ncbi:uncharacterized protein FTOL_03178 [Fusarium torulosum]|uniref:Uncharacterized protein n=1 Tax=Fusarium torulosum TaxID=33205 RepID=A0AAE8M471_9HYPO|nr:uncharacterized protein FTOL_03178 [Fusarium torulosum]